MPSILSRVLSRFAPRPAATPRSSPRPRPNHGPQRRSDFSLADTATWTFPDRPVVSSNLASVAYDFEAQVLQVRFRSGSRNTSDTVRYADVPLAVYRGLMDAPSHGRYFHRHIRGHYMFTYM